VAKLETDRNGVPGTWCSGHSKYSTQCIYHQKSLIRKLSFIFTLFFAYMLISIERILGMQCTDISRAILRVKKAILAPSLISPIKYTYIKYSKIPIIHHEII
jgi:hypothetical protein